MLTRIVPAVLALALLAGCSAAPQALTLVETKSPVQLLRNDAWYRLPEVMVKGDSETTDASQPCDDDPDGTMRAWHSSTVALVTNSQAPRVVLAGDNLAATYVAQGWEATRSEEGAAVLTVLTRSSSVAVIEIEALSKTEQHRASIRITASGPCVATAGADSDEVRDLERD
jgi:hypothetical protein